MKLLKCSAPKLTIEVIDLPRHAWRYTAPSRLAVTLAMVSIIAVAVVWAIVG